MKITNGAWIDKAKTSIITKTPTGVGFSRGCLSTAGRPMSRDHQRGVGVVEVVPDGRRAQGTAQASCRGPRTRGYPATSSPDPRRDRGLPGEVVGPPRAANRIVRLCTLPGGNAGERRRGSVIPMEDDFETDDDLELQDRREAPDYRMLIRGRSLVFSEWHPGLLGSHQVASTLERRGGARPFLADAVLDDRGGAFGWGADRHAARRPFDAQATRVDYELGAPDADIAAYG